MRTMTTVYVNESTKRELAKVAGELQRNSGERTNFDEAIRFLINFYKEKKKNAALFDRFTEAIPGVSFEQAYEELTTERNKDAKRLERKGRS